MLLQPLLEILAAEQIRAHEGEPHPLGNDALFSVYPRTEAEVSALVTLADKQGWSILPTGRGTKRGFGGLIDRVDLLLSLEQYTGIVEHSAADLTLTVRAGTTMQQIGEYLVPYGQMLALDPAWPTLASIGGVVAANESGPKRLRYGSARDHVLGLRVVYHDGKVLRSGGKTVKNVAGYDLNKLFVGSMGSLGIMSTITLKLRPLPKYESLCLLYFSREQLAELRSFLIKIQDSHLEPVSLELLSPNLTKKLGAEEYYSIAISFEDRESAVHDQENWLRAHVPQVAKLTILVQDEAKSWWHRFAQLAPLNSTQVISLKIGSNHLAVVDILKHCEELGQELAVHVLAHGGAGHGLSKVHLQGEEESLALFVQKIRAYAQELKGYVLIQHACLPFRKAHSVWGESPGYFPLLERIKATFDPERRLSPKRFIGGL